MRENIGLFRGKRIDTGDWVEGSFVVSMIETPSKTFDSYKIQRTIYGLSEDGFAEYMSGYEYEVDPDTIGECTGLRDKNGKLIFEGDIVRDMEVYSVHEGYVRRGLEDESCLKKYIDIGETAEVVFSIEYVGSCGCCYPKFEGSGFCAGAVNLNCCEIIGTVYDNPELLKGGEEE